MDFQANRRFLLVAQPPADPTETQIRRIHRSVRVPKFLLLVIQAEVVAASQFGVWRLPCRTASMRCWPDVQPAQWIETFVHAGPPTEMALRLC